ncbi:ATP-binding protein [Paenibacillus sp. FSL E2-0202]|jgi:ABC-type transport system involved in cytochrome c biogenesis ATPase subunit|uniref:AAA family ATPase n=1 Tax=unclassified Paenibacillus TaxID=185978 RepID=UPI0030ED6497
MLESPRVKNVLDELLRGKEINLRDKKIGPYSKDGIVVLKCLRDFSEREFIAPFGQDKLATLIRVFNQALTEVVISEASDDVQLDEVCSYKLGKLRASNFRGLQIFNGPVFEYNFDGRTQLISGSNGTGKSSIMNAIVWLFTGKLLWDRTEPSIAPVISLYEKKENNLEVNTIGRVWPSECALPSVEHAVKNMQSYNCWVEVELIPSSGGDAVIIRRDLTGAKKSKLSNMPILDDLSIDLSLIMPAKVNHIQFTADSDLAQIFLNVSGLDSMNYIGIYAKEMQKACTRYITQKSLEIDRIDRINRVLGEKISSRIPNDIKDEYASIGTTGELKDRIHKKQEWLTKQANERLIKLKEVLKLEEIEDFNVNDAFTQRLLTKIIAAHEAITQSSVTEWSIIKDFSKSIQSYNASEIIEFSTVITETTEQLLLALIWYEKKQEIKKLELMLQAVKLIPIDSDISNCPLCESILEDNNSVKAELIALKNLEDEASLNIVEIIKRCCNRLKSKVPHSLNVVNTSDFVQNFSKDVNAFIYRFLNNGLDELKANLDPKINALVSSVNFKEYLDEDIERTINKLGINDIHCILDDYTVLANEYLDKITVLNWINTNFDSFKIDIDNTLGYGNTPHSDSLIHILTVCKDIVLSIKPLQDACLEMEEYKNNLILKGKLFNEHQIIERIKQALIELESQKELADNLLADDLDKVISRIQIIYGELYGTDEFPLKIIEPVRSGRQIDMKFLVEHRGILVEAAPLINASRIRALLWAYIFAMSEIRSESTQRTWLNFTLLDDPLTSLDEGHRTRFARRVFDTQRKNQFIITSHDPDWPRHMKQYGVNPQIQRIKSLSIVRDVIDIKGWKAEVDIDLKSWNEDKKDEQLAKRFVESVRVWIEDELKDILVYAPTSPKVDDNLDGLMKKLNDAISRVNFYKSAYYRELYTELKKLPKDIHNAHHGGALRSRIYCDEADIISQSYTKISSFLDLCWDDFRSKIYTVSKSDLNPLSI